MIYKKYEHSQEATTLSQIGFWVALILSGLIGKLVIVVLDYFEISNGFAAIAIIVSFIGLMLLRNIATDAYARYDARKQIKKLLEWGRLIDFSNNTALENAAHVTIHRYSSFVGMLVAVPIFLNGESVSSLGDGKSVTIPITLKHNIISTQGIAQPLPKGAFVIFDAESGSNGIIHLSFNEGFKSDKINWK